MRIGTAPPNRNEIASAVDPFKRSEAAGFDGLPAELFRVFCAEFVLVEKKMIVKITKITLRTTEVQNGVRQSCNYFVTDTFSSSYR